MLNARGVAEDRWTGEREMWSCENFWNPDRVPVGRVGTYRTIWIEWETVELYGLGGNSVGRVGTYETLWIGWESGREQTTTLPLAFNMVGRWR